MYTILIGVIDDIQGWLEANKFYLSEYTVMSQVDFAYLPYLLKSSGYVFRLFCHST